MSKTCFRKNKIVLLTLAVELLLLSESRKSQDESDERSFESHFERTNGPGRKVSLSAVKRYVS